MHFQVDFRQAVDFGSIAVGWIDARLAIKGSEFQTWDDHCMIASRSQL